MDFFYSKKMCSVNPLAVFLERAMVCNNGKAFCIKAFNVKIIKSLGIYGLNLLLVLEC